MLKPIGAAMLTADIFSLSKISINGVRWTQTSCGYMADLP
jgi:hypothetical protein